MWQTAVSVLGRCVGAGREDKGEKRDRDAGEGTGRTCREREEALVRLPLSEKTAAQEIVERNKPHVPVLLGKLYENLEFGNWS